MNYFLFNKNIDYFRGSITNCNVEQGSIQSKSETGMSRFFSRTLDTKESGTIWHRMKLTVQKNQGNFTFLFYASDDLEIVVDQKQWMISDLIISSEFTDDRKKQLLEPYLKKQIWNQDDILLHDVQGRYLWFCLEMQKSHLEELCFYFPKETWMQYLPQVYQTGMDSQCFSERFLSIFQSVYDDFDQQIEQSHYELEPLTTNKEMLYFLAEILNIEQVPSWEEDKLRLLLSKAHQLFQKRGTKKGLEEILMLYMGEEPHILEDTQTPNQITVLINEKYLTGRERNIILGIIYTFVPVGIEVNLVDLRDYFLLGDPLYISVNSKTTTYDAMKLDGVSRVGYSVVGCADTSEKNGGV